MKKKKKIIKKQKRKMNLGASTIRSLKMALVAFLKMKIKENFKL